MEPENPLLWVLRDNIGLTGTICGRGIAMCGACALFAETGKRIRRLPIRNHDLAA